MVESTAQPTTVPPATATDVAENAAQSSAAMPATEADKAALTESTQQQQQQRRLLQPPIPSGSLQASASPFTNAPIPTTHTANPRAMQKPPVWVGGRSSGKPDLYVDESANPPLHATLTVTALHPQKKMQGQSSLALTQQPSAGDLMSDGGVVQRKTVASAVDRAPSTLHDLASVEVTSDVRVISHPRLFNDTSSKTGAVPLRRGPGRPRKHPDSWYAQPARYTKTPMIFAGMLDGRTMESVTAPIYPTTRKKKRGPYNKLNKRSKALATTSAHSGMEAGAATSAHYPLGATPKKAPTVQSTLTKDKISVKSASAKATSTTLMATQSRAAAVAAATASRFLGGSVGTIGPAAMLQQQQQNQYQSLYTSPQAFYQPTAAMTPQAVAYVMAQPQMAPQMQSMYAGMYNTAYGNYGYDPYSQASNAMYQMQQAQSYSMSVMQQQQQQQQAVQHAAQRAAQQAAQHAALKQEQQMQSALLQPKGFQSRDRHFPVVLMDEATQARVSPYMKHGEKSTVTMKKRQQEVLHEQPQQGGGGTRKKLKESEHEETWRAEPRQKTRHQTQTQSNSGATAAVATDAAIDVDDNENSDCEVLDDIDGIDFVCSTTELDDIASNSNSSDRSTSSNSNDDHMRVLGKAASSSLSLHLSRDSRAPSAATCSSTGRTRKQPPTMPMADIMQTPNIQRPIFLRKGLPQSSKKYTQGARNGNSAVLTTFATDAKSAPSDTRVDFTARAAVDADMNGAVKCALQKLGVGEHGEFDDVLDDRMLGDDIKPRTLDASKLDGNTHPVTLRWTEDRRKFRHFGSIAQAVRFIGCPKESVARFDDGTGCTVDGWVVSSYMGSVPHNPWVAVQRPATSFDATILPLSTSGTPTSISDTDTDTGTNIEAMSIAASGASNAPAVPACTSASAVIDTAAAGNDTKCCAADTFAVHTSPCPPASSVNATPVASGNVPGPAANRQKAVWLWRIDDPLVTIVLPSTASAASAVGIDVAEVESCASGGTESCNGWCASYLPPPRTDCILLKSNGVDPLLPASSGVITGTTATAAAATSGPAKPIGDSVRAMLSKYTPYGRRGRPVILTHEDDEDERWIFSQAAEASKRSNIAQPRICRARGRGVACFGWFVTDPTVHDLKIAANAIEASGEKMLHAVPLRLSDRHPTTGAITAHYIWDAYGKPVRRQDEGGSLFAGDEGNSKIDGKRWCSHKKRDSKAVACSTEGCRNIAEARGLCDTHGTVRSQGHLGGRRLSQAQRAICTAGDKVGSGLHKQPNQEVGNQAVEPVAVNGKCILEDLDIDSADNCGAAAPSAIIGSNGTTDGHARGGDASPLHPVLGGSAQKPPLSKKKESPPPPRNRPDRKSKASSNINLVGMDVRNRGQGTSVLGSNPIESSLGNMRTLRSQVDAQRQTDVTPGGRSTRNMKVRTMPNDDDATNNDGGGDSDVDGDGDEEQRTDSSEEEGSDDGTDEGSSGSTDLLFSVVLSLTTDPKTRRFFSDVSEGSAYLEVTRAAFSKARANGTPVNGWLINKNPQQNATSKLNNRRSSRHTSASASASAASASADGVSRPRAVGKRKSHRWSR